MDIPSVSNFAKGFERALKEVDHKNELTIQYANSFTDSAKGKAIAQNMLKEGVDIAFSAGGGVNTGVWEACVEANIKSIGVDMPSSQFSPSIITSALKRVDVGVESVIKDLVDGKFEGGKVKMFDISNQGVGYELTDHLSDDVVKYVEDKIKSN